MIILHTRNGAILGLFRDGVVQEGYLIIGNEYRTSRLQCEWSIVPDQDWSHLLCVDDAGESVINGTLADLRQFSPIEKAALVDRDTGQAITSQVHPFAGTEEQIGILRAQIVSVLNKLGIEATPEFAALNEIAIAAIEAAREKKVSNA